MTHRTDLTIIQGTTWSYSWQIVGYDLTDASWSARSQARVKHPAETVLTEFQTTITGDIVTIAVGPAESSAWQWERGVYDVEIYSSDGRVLRIAEGTVSVSPEVTR